MPFSLDPLPEENEFECANCGAYFHVEQTRCPQCGINLYEPDRDSVQPNRTFKSPSPQTSILRKITLFFKRLVGKSDLAEELFGVYQEQVALYHDLLGKVGGDSNIVERLIIYERKISPSANRTTCLQRAIWRWERDNRSKNNKENTLYDSKPNP